MSPYIYLLLAHPGSILSYFGNVCTSETGVDCSSTGLPHPGGGDVGGSQLQSILSIVFAILAALSVLFIVLAAFRMVTAQGDSQQVSKARSTIIYALAGLIVAMLAEAFVAFVLDRLVS
jgi:hypothetical protein